MEYKFYSVKEKEAMKKWCPFVRHFSASAEGASGSFNRYDSGKPVDGSFCLGSECMAWRWITAAYAEEGGQLGYCGLAGEVKA